MKEHKDDSNQSEMIPAQKVWVWDFPISESIISTISKTIQAVKTGLLC